MAAGNRITVVICTHSPRRDFLNRTLKCLAEQTLGANAFDLVIVDNASAEPVASWCDLSWHPSARVVVETTVGLTSARLRGISEVRTDLLVWVDDDNLLAPDYLTLAADLARDWPMLGVWGCGHFTPEWETAPAAELTPYLSYLAVGSVAHDSWSNHAFDYATMPAGAGLCVRSDVAQRYAEAVRTDPRRRALGRTGTGLGACEDFDLGLTAVECGYGTGVFTRLRLTHIMPAGRVREDYLLRLVEGHARSTVLLMAIRGKEQQPPANDWKSRLRELRLRRSFSPVQLKIHDARRRGEISAWQTLNTGFNAA